MSVILHIETSTDLCSVAVSQDSAIIFQTDNLKEKERTAAKGTNHASILGVMVDEALSFTDNHAIPFDAVAVSAGRAVTQACASVYRWQRGWPMAET